MVDHQLVMGLFGIGLLLGFIGLDGGIDMRLVLREGGRASSANAKARTAKRGLDMADS